MYIFFIICGKKLDWNLNFKKIYAFENNTDVKKSKYHE